MFSNKEIKEYIKEKGYVKTIEKLVKLWKSAKRGKENDNISYYENKIVELYEEHMKLNKTTGLTNQQSDEDKFIPASLIESILKEK